jgi:hypothetical protein
MVNNSINIIKTKDSLNSDGQQFRNKNQHFYCFFLKYTKSLHQWSVHRQQFSVCWTGFDLLTACPTFIGYLKYLHTYVCITSLWTL